MGTRLLRYAAPAAFTLLVAACSAGASGPSPAATPAVSTGATSDATAGPTGPSVGAGDPTTATATATSTPSPPASPAATSPAAHRTTAATPTHPSGVATPAPAPVGAGLRISDDPIPYPQARKDEMAAYSARHYGSASWTLTPKVIVLHFTESDTWTSARAAFAADVPDLGELPGTCAHYLVDQGGLVHALVPTSVRCRHAIGLNDAAIGIEFVQATHGHSSTWADQQILARSAQAEAGLALVRSLQAQYGIATADVIGHASANAHPLFHDRLGWRNDHTDWQPVDVGAFRARL